MSKGEVDENLFLLWVVDSLYLQADGFPTLLFFPAGNKSFDPVSDLTIQFYAVTRCFFTFCLKILLIWECFWYSFQRLLLHVHIRSIRWHCQITVDTDRTVVAFYKFLKKHASIPFKLQKPTPSPRPENVEAKASEESVSTNNKDELWVS